MQLSKSTAVVIGPDGVDAPVPPQPVADLDLLAYGSLANESYDVAFVASNSDIWMDHCHNLKHSAQGMGAHLMYEGFDIAYRIAGPADNQPE